MESKEPKDEREVLIPLFPRSSFHKLLFAQRHIKDLTKTVKDLKIEIGMLKSEIDELADTKNLAGKYKTAKADIRSLNKYVLKLKNENKRLRQRYGIQD